MMATACLQRLFRPALRIEVVVGLFVCVDQLQFEATTGAVLAQRLICLIQCKFLRFVAIVSRYHVQDNFAIFFGAPQLR